MENFSEEELKNIGFSTREDRLVIVLSREEAKLIADEFSHYYISYENPVARELVKALMNFANNKTQE